MRVTFCATRAVVRRYQKELEQFAIEVTVRRLGEGRVSTSDSIGQFEVAVLELDAMSAQQRHEAIADFQRQGTCVVGLAGPACERPWQEHLEDDLDGVVTLDCSSLDLACAVWSAHRQFELRRVLAQRVEELQLTLGRRKRIEQAKAVIAEMLEITESEALKHLRREARNRRRPMHELAHVVIEAREILCHSNPRNVAQQSGAKENEPLRTTLMSSLRLAE